MVASIGVTVLGSTGSIGMNTLDVISRQQEKFHIIALTANTQAERLLEQCKAFNPKYAVMRDADAAQVLHDSLKRLDLQTQVLSGIESLEMVASLPECAYVMAAIVGAAGLRPTLAAARAGKRVLLANKEALVMSGNLFMQEIKRNGAELLPIDSEHNAIFQCMPAVANSSLDAMGVKRILLTASGGPFRTTPLDELATVNPEQACAHPNWVMGRKISVDSSTMMNKGLEVIEACWLFNTAPSQIQVVIHPQSVIHSMVEYVDGSVLAQLGNPDMRTPIAHALAWPERMASGVSSLDLFQVARLDFEPPDIQRFPCLRLSMEVAETGGTSSAILNAANELAVDAFLERRIGFLQIAQVIEHCLTQCSSREMPDLDSVMEADLEARAEAQAFVARLAPQTGVIH